MSLRSVLGVDVGPAAGVGVVVVVDPDLQLGEHRVGEGRRRQREGEHAHDLVDRGFAHGRREVGVVVALPDAA